MSARALALAAVAIASCAAACNSPPSTTRVAATPNDTQAVMARSGDPRSADPTAATPTPTTLPPGGVAVGGAPPPKPSAATDPLEKPKAKGPPPARIGARHVLVQWMGSERAGSGVLRSREQARAIAEEVLKKAKGGADLGRLAVEYSDEPNAGPRGGSLGRFGKGQMVPAFEEAAFKLEVGEVSDIIETPFGFHVIQRTE